jgi:hypothetical protein
MEPDHLLFLQSLTHHVTGYTLLQTARFAFREYDLEVLRGYGRMKPDTERFLSFLIAEKLVKIASVLAAPPFDFVGAERFEQPGIGPTPLLFWTPDAEATPNENTFRKVSTHLLKRELPECRKLSVVVATEKGAEAVGGVSPRFSIGAKLCHDLSVSDLVVCERRTAGLSCRFLSAELHGLQDEDQLGATTFWVHNAPKSPWHDALTRCWRGEAWLNAHGLKLGNIVPDLAWVEDGKVVFAADFGGRYDVARLKAIHKGCSENGVVYGVF